MSAIGHKTHAEATKADRLKEIQEALYQAFDKAVGLAGSGLEEGKKITALTAMGTLAQGIAAIDDRLDSLS